MNFDESSAAPVVQEFAAVVLAGFGNELLPLTSTSGDEPSPKALLPIANKPMLEYPLIWLEESGIRDVLLICPAPHRSAMSNYIQSDSSSAFPSLRIDLQTFEESQDLPVGTCTILRHFASRIQYDFVLLPCDFVPPPALALSQILNKFRTESLYDGAIATTCFYELRKGTDKNAPEEWGAVPTPVPIVWDEKTGTLLHVDTPDDVDRNGEELEIRMSLLSKYPRARLSASLLDSHIYVCRRHVLDALQEKSNLDSIREEFIPWLCKPQYQRTRRQKYGSILVPPSNTSVLQREALKHSTVYLDLERDLHLSAGSPDGSAASPLEDDERASAPSLRVGLHIHKADDGFSARANTLHAYLELNRHFLSQTTYALPTDQKSRSLIDQKAQISSDSMIGLFTRVDERTSIKKSVIGQHCVIGKMVKIAGCVILDHCVIEDGAKLDGCILGKSTKVAAKAELSKCVTQSGYEVNAGESYKNEKLEISDWAAASNSEEGSDEDEDDDADSDEEEESD